MNLQVGRSISWGSNNSRIYDDSQLHTYTDDNTYFDIKANHIIRTNPIITKFFLNINIAGDFTGSCIEDAYNGVTTNYNFIKAPQVVTTFYIIKKNISITIPISYQSEAIYSYQDIILTLTSISCNFH